MGRKIQMRQLTHIIALVVLGIFWGASNEASAAEKRCDALGANCICSEPLNTATYTTTFGYDFNPADTTIMQCTKATSSAPGSVLEDGSGFRYVVESTGPMFTALPNKSAAITKLLRTKISAEGNAGGGGQFIGLQFPPSAPSQRVAFRGYKYFSPDYVLNNGSSGGTCVNSSKLLQMGHNSQLSFLVAGDGSNALLYGWTGFNYPTIDCCRVGPGPVAAQGGYTTSVINGKWWRIEAVFTNRLTTGPPSVFKMWRKNVTDNLPEELIIDTSVPTTQVVGATWTPTYATTLKPVGSDFDQIVFDLFRRDLCAGYVGISHIMAAAWDTDAGQRIGAAVEIEGGGSSDVSPPLAPLNLRISMLP